MNFPEANWGKKCFNLHFSYVSSLPEEHEMAIQEYFRTSVCLDAEQVQNGNPNLPGLKKLIMAVCKNLNR